MNVIINPRDSGTVLLENLHNGDNFVFGGDAYLFIGPDNAKTTDHIIAVNLSEYEIYEFSNTLEVVPVLRGILTITLL